MIAFYLTLAVAFISLGIGSIRARRWAWTLMVILSWVWLIGGALEFVFFLLLGRRILSASIEQQGNAELKGNVSACDASNHNRRDHGLHLRSPAGRLFDLLPAGVRAPSASGAIDRSRWTDRCPMPVLALSILLALWVLWMPAMMLFTLAMPLFGVFLSGPAGAAVILFVTPAMAWLAWGSYRLKMAAWWGLLLLFIVGTVVAVVTFSRTA